MSVNSSHLFRHKRRVQLLGLLTSRSWPSGPQKAIWCSTTLPDSRKCQSWESTPVLSPVLHGTTQKSWQWVQQTSRYRLWSCHQETQVLQLVADMRKSCFAKKPYAHLHQIANQQLPKSWQQAETNSHAITASMHVHPEASTIPQCHHCR